MPPATRRYHSLDSLRGVAATLVVFFHVNWNNHITGFHFFRHSFLFVDLFFILSGFIISVIYEDRVRTFSDAARFMTLRFFRLYPLHLATLMFLVGLELLKYVFVSYRGLSLNSEVFSFQRTIPAIFVNLTFLQGIGVLDNLSWNTPSWSISCEMAAYAAFALLGLLGLLAPPFRWLALLPICAGYTYIMGSHGTLNVTFDIGTIRCFCGFFGGSLIARLPPAPLPNVLVFASSLAAILVISLLSGPAEILAVPAFAVLVFALRNDESTIATFLVAKPLAFLGTVSFSIYLVHYVVISVMGTILKVASQPRIVSVTGWEVQIFDISPFLGDCLVAISVLCSFGIATITYRLIETPGRKLGYRLASRFDT
jgi:peptidoglycan/LPS O-acetylase OafA/YrhL